MEELKVNQSQFDFTCIVNTLKEQGYQEDVLAVIASAPELLEACKRALPWMGKLIASRVHEDCVMPNDAVRTMEMLEAYIAKAEGRS